MKFAIKKDSKLRSLMTQVDRLQKDLNFAGDKGTAVVKTASLREVLEFVRSTKEYKDTVNK